VPHTPLFVPHALAGWSTCGWSYELEGLTRKPVGDLNESMPDLIIGHRDFVDGTRRAVYRDAQGQYVQGNDGERLYGWWMMPTEEEWEEIPMAVQLT